MKIKPVIPSPFIQLLPANNRISQNIRVILYFKPPINPAGRLIDILKSVWYKNRNPCKIWCSSIEEKPKLVVNPCVFRVIPDCCLRNYPQMVVLIYNRRKEYSLLKVISNDDMCFDCASRSIYKLWIPLIINLEIKFNVRIMI